MTHKGWLLYWLGLTLVAALPVASAALGTAGADRCDRDGVELPELFRVRIALGNGMQARCCSVRCAEEWVALAGALPLRIFVVDESTGDEIDAAHAWFARSSIVTSTATGERIHAFGCVSGAEVHVAAYGGLVLEGRERPLQRTPVPATIEKGP